MEPPTIVVNVDVVDVVFNVKNGNRLVSDQQKDDFLLLEDGKPQEIRYFAFGSQRPLSLAILVDTSTSQDRVLHIEREVGENFLRQTVSSGDRVLLASFGSRVRVRQDFTASVEKLTGALMQAIAREETADEELDSPPDLRTTALYDAVQMVARGKFNEDGFRKAMLILTDGQDNGSRIKIGQAIAAALNADTTCYVLLIGDPREMTTFSYVGVQRMERLARDTGGVMIRVGTDQERLRAAFTTIAADLRHQYSIGYLSTNKQWDGTFRKVEIHSRCGFKVRHRRGYFAVPHRSSSTPQ